MKEDVLDFLSKIEKRTGVSLQSVRDLISAEREKPLSAAIFGQTGCGKSSLTNAIFGTTFDVDDVKPCTKEPQAHQSQDSNGNAIIFWDLPGIGESEEADKDYIDLYAEYAATCDVVLWAFQADTRTMTLDASALNAIVHRLGPEKRGQFLDQLSVVVTKADVISPGPWIFAKNGNQTMIASSKETEETLERKAIYFYEGLLGPHQAEIVHRTFVSSKPRHLTTLPPNFWLDESEKFLCHKGTLDSNMYTHLAGKYPNALDEIDRLHEQSKAVCCSARYSFNLNAVKAKIAQKSRGKSMLRLSQSITSTDSTLPWSRLRELGLPVFFNQETGTTIFNVEDI